MNMTSRTDIKCLAKQIETLAHEVQVKVDNGEDILSLSNELVRNNITLVFTLGEVYALEKSASTKSSGLMSKNRHTVRDARSGRFIRKV